MARVRLALSTLLATLALLDNATTILAVARGAAEANPLVVPFLSSTHTFAAFTAVKVLLSFYLTYTTYSKSTTWLLLYASIVAIFATATATNILNALKP